jgi:hypothetical protein
VGKSNSSRHEVLKSTAIETVPRTRREKQREEEDHSGMDVVVVVVVVDPDRTVGSVLAQNREPTIKIPRKATPQPRCRRLGDLSTRSLVDHSNQ